MTLSYLEMLDALGAEPTRAQAEFAAVAFDRMQAGSDSESERIWGSRNFAPPPDAFRVVGAVCGRGSGKSRFFGAYRLLHLALTVPISALPRGEDAVCPIVAPDLDTARHTLNFARGAAELLVPTAIESSAADSFVLRREGGKRVRVAAKAASAGGKSIRGRSMPGALLEELAFFFDKEHRVNDAEIFRALLPRIMPGGQLLAISTPWSRAGKLWDLYSENYGHPRSAIIAHAPTLLMRDGGPGFREISADVAAMHASDSENARREYDAEFMSANAQAYFDSRAIERATDADLAIPADPLVALATADDARPAIGVEFGGDFGFTRDSSALVGVARAASRFAVCDLLELTPSAGPLKPSETVAAFAARVKAFGGSTMTADMHYRESIREALAQHELYLLNAPEGVRGKNDTYAIARTVLHAGEMRLPRHERFLRQLAQVESRPTSGGLLSISSPRWSGGGHGDIVSAWVLATWRAYKHGSPEKSAEKGIELRITEKLARMKRRADSEYDYGD